VIDYALAFIGGIDLCFGRWDANQHPLADVHPAGLRDDIFPGQDFNNNRIMDFQGVQDWQSNELSKADCGRMPWHDVAMGLVGDCVYDIAEHFVLRWNFVKRDKYKRADNVDWLMMEGRLGADEDLVAVQRPKYPCGEYIQHPLSPLSTKPRGQQGSVRAQIVRSSDDWSSGILNEHSIQNAYCEIIRNAEHFVYIENQFFSTPIFASSPKTVFEWLTFYQLLLLATSSDPSSIPSVALLSMLAFEQARKDASSVSSSFSLPFQALRATCVILLQRVRVLSWTTSISPSVAASIQSWVKLRRREWILSVSHSPSR
jgi:hypothetical protein